MIPRRYETLTEVERVRAYHLLPRGVSKVAGIAADRAYRGLEREECAMVGDAAADLECRGEVGRCFLVRNGLDKDPSLAWALEPDSGVEVTEGRSRRGLRRGGPPPPRRGRIARSTPLLVVRDFPDQ